MQNLSSDKGCLDGSIHCSKTCLTFNINGAFPHGQVAYFIDTNASSIASELQAFELSSDNKLDRAASFYSGGSGVHVFQKEFQIWVPLTTKQEMIEKDDRFGLGQ